MSTQRRVFSKNPIFVIIVSNEDGELKRLYYNVMFCRGPGLGEHLQRPPRTYTSKKIGNKPRSRVAGKAKYISMPLMDRCSFLFAQIRWHGLTSWQSASGSNDDQVDTWSIFIWTRLDWTSLCHRIQIISIFFLLNWFPSQTAPQSLCFMQTSPPNNPTGPTIYLYCHQSDHSLPSVAACLFAFHGHNCRNED